jgi:hypothetical protein
MGQGSLAKSPYIIGAGLGLLDMLSFLSAKRGLGVTTPFENVAALTARRVAPDVLHINEYMKQPDTAPKIDWESFLVLGIAAGGFIAARAAGERRPRRFSPIWTRRFGSSALKRYVGAFLGGAVMMFGARMAKGCTSGHSLTGNMQFAVSSGVFTSLMFASSVLVARALYGKENR